MSRHALCVGINNYPGTQNDLKGCVNDAYDWGNLLDEYGFSVVFLLDQTATKNSITIQLEKLVDELKPGDLGVFTYSGHGTQDVDRSGDEEDGYDEALFVYDGIFLDDDLRRIFDYLDPDADLIVVLDSCFSGTATRLADRGAYSRARFVPPEGGFAHMPLRRQMLSEMEMPELLLTGCTDREYSYDAMYGGRYNGALTRNAIDVMRLAPDATYDQFYTELRKRLPSREYPQTPQLEGKATEREKILFLCDEDWCGNDIPTPPPAPAVGCYQWLMNIFRRQLGRIKPK